MLVGDIGEMALTIPGLKVRESFLPYLYDDANDKHVTAPIGNASIGYGENVQAGWSKPFAAKVLQLRAEEFQEALLQLSWYVALNAVRRSVVLEIAYNAGLGGLLHYHNMIAALMVSDWAKASAECGTSNPKLKARYAILAGLLLTG